MVRLLRDMVGRREEGDEVGSPGHDPRFGWCLLLGVAYSSSVGGMTTPDALAVVAPRIDARRVLVRLPNWVGDVVMATSTLRAVRDTWPAAEIVVEPAL